MYGKSGKSRTLIIPAVLLIALASCATAPPIAERDLSRLLEAGAPVYVGLDVAGNRELVTQLAADLGIEAEAAVQRLDVVIGALGGDGDSLPFSGVAIGRLPKGAISYALLRDRGFDRSVARLESGRFVYFQSSDGAYQIAVPETGLVLVTTGSVVRLAESLDADRAPVSEPVAAALSDLSDPEGRDVFLVVPEPQALIRRQGLQLDRFPVTGLSLAVYAGPESLELRGLFSFETETQALLFSRLGRVLVLAFVRSLGLEAAGIRETLEIEPDGLELGFWGIEITQAELASLVTEFAAGDTQ